MMLAGLFDFALQPAYSIRRVVNELVLMAHVVFGVACLLAALWVFVDVLNFSETHQGRIRTMSWAAAVAMWLAFLIGG